MAAARHRVGTNLAIWEGGFDAQGTQIAQRRKVTVVRDYRVGPDCQCARRLDRNG